MKITELKIGMAVLHKEHGRGTVHAITQQTAQIQFTSGLRTLDPETAGIIPEERGPTETPAVDLREVALEALRVFEEERINPLVEELGTRWQGGVLLMQPADKNQQPKEIPIEKFFHKVVMVRNNLRLIEQKINASSALTDGDKVELQQYVTRIYGSLTTFNILFSRKEGQFVGSKGNS